MQPETAQQVHRGSHVLRVELWLGALLALVLPGVARALPGDAPSTAPAPLEADLEAPTSTATTVDAKTRLGVPDELRIAVYELRVEGVPARVGRLTTDALTTELRKLKGVNAIGMDEIRAMLAHEASKQLLGCDQESCLGEIAGALGVDELVTGSLTRVGQTSVLSLRRLDMLNAQARGSVERRLTPDNGEEFLAALGPAVEQLFPEQALVVGARRGVDAEVALDLNPPPLPVWVFASTAGATALLALAGGGATVMAGLSYAAFNELAASSVAPGDPVPYTSLQDRQRQAEGWDVARTSLYVAAAVVGVAAAVEVFFTDWLDRQSRGERE
ncbi:MAG: hypothetical protein ABIJ09_06745 [Pseudomonadota bacterium]